MKVYSLLMVGKSYFSRNKTNIDTQSNKQFYKCFLMFLNYNHPLINKYIDWVKNRKWNNEIASKNYAEICLLFLTLKIFQKK